MHNSIIHRILLFSQRYSVFIIIFITIITVVLGFFAVNVEFIPDVQSLIPENESVSQLFEKYGEGLSKREYLVVTVESEELFVVEKLKAFEKAIIEIESLPGIGQSINPFKNLITFKKEEDKLQIVPLAIGNRAPQNEEELEVFKERILKEPFAQNFLISSDGTVLTALFPFEEIKDYSALMDLVNSILSGLESYFKIRIGGPVPFENEARFHLISDFPKLMVLALIIILINFYFGFRAGRSVILPIFVVSIGTIWTIGFMTLCGFAISVISIVIPPLVLTLGSSYTIHILNQYYREAEVNPQNKAWIVNSVEHVNKTVVMASLTTVIGFVSLLVTSIKQVREFGFASSFGIISCAILSIFLLPAALSFLKPPTSVQQKRILAGFIVRVMEKLSYFVLKAKIPILVLLIIIIILFAFSLNNLNYRSDYINYFPKEDRAVQDTKFLIEKFGGFQHTYITFNAPGEEKNYFLKPDVLQKISQFEEKLNENPDITYTLSFVSYIKQLNYLKTGEYVVPTQRGIIRYLSGFMQSFLNTSGEQKKGFLHVLTNSDFNTLTIVIRAYDSENNRFLFDKELKKLMNEIETDTKEIISEDLTPEMWGPGLRFLSLYETINRDQAFSMCLALLLIFILTSIVFRSVFYGFLSLIPLGTGVMLNFIIMAVFGIPLDMITVMVSSVAIGIGVDDSIHFLLRFRSEAKKNPDDINHLVTTTMKTTGRPILLTSVSIVAGLLVLLLASFIPIIYFGLLVALALANATIGCLVILPAILSLKKRH